ncbi:uncharacterized protein LOC129284422 [Prosopis cineraria]|uniref:uncharacterized protein LOC129284422 n=1 Tax=Prosopis cineraria TaxID=364024 RepID=UPI00240EAA61|nr:uncharacterized protein LOC129284422 [Prosopis cineraria]
MYVTRPLSFYKKSAESLSLGPPEGPHSGILVIQDDEVRPSCSSSPCFGEFHQLKVLPFPQNRNIELFYRSGISLSRATHYRHVAFIPVLDKPLSSNLYYVIQLNERHRGDAFTSIEEEDLETFCFYNSVPVEPHCQLDISNEHQVFEVFPRRSKITFRKGFSAKPVAPHTFAPKFLSARWRVKVSDSVDSSLGEAAGVDNALRARLPEFNFSMANTNPEAVVVGKWYCPLMFIKEGTHRTLRDEMRRSLFYEMTLQQRWERVFSLENDRGTENRTVTVDVVVQKEKVVVAEREVETEEIEVEGVKWFKSCNNIGEESSVGLSTAIIERMKWEQVRFGWVEGKEKKVRIQKTEEFKGTGKWKRFGCYVLVESFVLKRLDGSLVLTYDFKHHHQVRSKWE